MADYVVRDIGELEKVLMGEIEGLVQNIGLAIAGEEIIATPVKTGRAMGSWVASLGHPPTVVIDGLASADRMANAAEASARAIRQATATIRRFRLGREGIVRSGEGDIWLVNSTPYILDLNNGSSRQAPAGFIDLALQRAMTNVGTRQVV
ncbi:hypothetical protein M0R72_08730 [Candidatus Pacearchaeota archaeon]|jgi:hypothetical protein|nr:hypothetical protein [Candidatus Pacearchaeota archaeon]